jgi:hypothetical protein
MLCKLSRIYNSFCAWLEEVGLVSFNQVEICLESWKKEFQPQKDMVILNSTFLIS